MRQPVAYSMAEPSDYPGIRRLLTLAGLPHSDLDVENVLTFVLARQADTIVGVAGLEVHGDVGLARSLAVHPARRCEGIGSELLRQIVQLARENGLHELYTLTETIEDLLVARGFRRLDRSAAPEAIQQTAEFQGLCPESAALLVLDLA